MTGFGSLSPFGGPHLGSRLDALADGQVAHDERDRLLAHVAGCPSCRAELQAARAVKAQLGRLGQPCVPSDLTSRLLSLPSVAACAPEPEPVVPSSHLRRPHAGAASFGLLVGAALLVAVPAMSPSGGSASGARATTRAPRPPATRPSVPSTESDAAARRAARTAPTRSSAESRIAAALSDPTAAELSFPLGRAAVTRSARHGGAASEPIERLSAPLPLLAATLQR
ncbi:putative zinc finger protein [Motilibacter peucedani]|uniref:Putative zinc finger protein n=1 Tax=Motilibacter peucedani TaxID=598650 RepID=A0A420XMH4_9ACTN|nr:anti-sigma factor [Motilibacter peucedani]RKS72465.1 putative zinc finger protein [Motilibacter peucedani]